MLENVRQLSNKTGTTSPLGTVANHTTAAHTKPHSNCYNCAMSRINVNNFWVVERLKRMKIKKQGRFLDTTAHAGTPAVRRR